MRTDPLNVLKESIVTCFSKAWTSLYITLAFQLVSFGMGVALIWEPELGQNWLYIILLILLAGGLAYFTFQSNKLGASAQKLLRAKEFWEGLGIKPNARLLMEASVDATGQLEGSKLELLTSGLAFASAAVPGKRRLLENVQESSWYSKRLSYEAFIWLAITAVFFVVASWILLFYASSHPSSPATGLKTLTISDFLTQLGGSLIAFVISARFIETAVAYLEFSRAAEETLTRATELIKKDRCDDAEAINVVAEYQVARACAPPLPTRLWLNSRIKMNAAWESFRGSINE